MSEYLRVVTDFSVYSSLNIDDLSALDLYIDFGYQHWNHIYHK